MFICSLYNAFALTMLDKVALMRWKKSSHINYLLLFFENPFSKILNLILAYDCSIMDFLTASFRL